MADLFLTWDEAQGEELPHYCVSCAAPATEWADWRICKTQYLFLMTRYTYVDVTLTVCPQHRNLSWFILRRIVAREIHSDGVVVGHVSPGFVEAVWDYRENLEFGILPISVRPSHRQDFDADDFDDRRPARRSRTAYAPSGWTPGKIILLVFVLLSLAPCALLLLSAILVGVLHALL